MTKRNADTELTVVYEDAGSCWVTASIPLVPGTISSGRTQSEARRNVVDALRTMLSTRPERLPEGASAERVSVTLALGRRHAQERSLDR